jgi:hypothetical protein
VIRSLKAVAAFGLLIAYPTVAGCSGNATPPCDGQYVGSAGAIYGLQVSPTSGATGVPTSVRTLVFSEATDFDIVLELLGGSTTVVVQTTPTALPSPYQTNAPGTGTNGYYAVSVPTLSAKTTYATGVSSDQNYCAGDYHFYQFGTFTTQ